MAGTKAASTTRERVTESLALDGVHIFAPGVTLEESNISRVTSTIYWTHSMRNDLHDVACPTCGYDGPHPVLADDGTALTAECTECVNEFEYGYGDDE